MQSTRPIVPRLLLLLVVTPSLKGEERERLLELHPSPVAEYEPHSRATAQRHEPAPTGGG